MGLPMYQNNDEVDAHDAAAKPDRAASARRSTIRRETTLRAGQDPRRRASPPITMHEDYRDRVLRRRRLSLERDQRQIEHLEAELERLRRNRMRSRARLELENENLPTHTRETRGLTIVGEDDTGVAPHDVMRPRLPPPSSDSTLRFVDSYANVSSHGSTSPRRYRSSGRPYMPSPPYSLNSDRHGRRSPDGPLRPEDGPVELTPNFAPAHGLSGRPRGPYESIAREIIGQARAVETPPPEEWEGSYPPLRRVGHISPRLGSRGSHYDGLGDRRRSVSPNSSDSHEEETWETLMTTMDDDQPTVQTSFASTTRSDFATGSNRSSQTAATSFGEIGQLDDTCDLDLPYGITEEDARELRARHQRNDLGGVEHFNTSLGALGRQTDAFERATERLGTSEHVRRNLEIIEQRSAELSMFQNILARMQRREEVPAELWAAVGLSPVVWDSLAPAASSAATEQRESRANA